MDESLRDRIQEIRYEIFTIQSEIICLQSEVIQDQLELLMQHTSIDDEDYAAIKEKIDRAAMLRAELDF